MSSNVTAAAQKGAATTSDQLLFERVGEFLTRNRLSPDPLNYGFGYRVYSDPDGALAKAVAALTDGGIRLTRNDVVSLGGDVTARVAAPVDHSHTQGLVAATQMQVEGFQDLVRSIRSDTRDFSRDLAATADAIRIVVGPDNEVVRITGAMLDRVQSAESQLEAANREADDLRQKLEEARDNARRDPLTGLPNRRAFEEAYAERLAMGEPMCIAVCDIDHFKLVNDGFGHAVGDRVLKSIADVLGEECAPHLVARYGGEEFVALFVDVDLVTAQNTLEAARDRVARKRYRLRETDTPLGEVTFSAGLTAARFDEESGMVFERADRLLYAAKADGRNCVKTG